MKKTFLLLLNFFLLCLNVNASEKVAHSPKVNMWVTDSGMKVAFVRVPNMIINLELAFHAGSSRDGANYGLAFLTNNLVSAGGEKLSLDEIASQLDNSGAIFLYNSGKDDATLSLQSLSSKEFFEPAISTFTDMIKAPNFSDNDFTRIRSHALQEIKFKAQSPNSVAYKNFFSAMYHDHPYSHPSYGTEETVKLISQDMVKSFYNKYYCRENAVLAIVGDITEKEAHVLANRISSSLPSGATLPSLQVMKEISSADVKVTYPSSQSTLVLGGLGVTPKNKDIFALDLASSILGGGLDSRLSTDIREKRGLVYGISAFIHPMELRGPFIISTQTKSENANVASEEIKRIVADFVAHGAKEEELRKVKKINISYHYEMFSQNFAIANVLASNMIHDLPSTYLEDYVSNVNKVTLEDVNKAISKYMKLNPLVSVVVGPNE